MNNERIAQYTGLSLNEVKRLRSMSAQEVFSDSAYIKTLKKLDRHFLESTLADARHAYAIHMDEFKTEIKNRYGISSEPMSAFTLGNWVVGVLQYPDQAKELLRMHGNVGGDVFSGSIEQVLTILEDMPTGTREWQQAMCLLAFPMMNK